MILGAVQDTTRTGACTSRAHDSENQREPTRDDERQDMGLDLGFLASRCLSQGALKWPQKPSHGRGHWFDPSIAHSWFSLWLLGSSGLVPFLDRGVGCVASRLRAEAPEEHIGAEKGGEPLTDRNGELQPILGFTYRGWVLRQSTDRVQCITSLWFESG